AERIRDVKDLKVGRLSVGATYSFGPLLKQTVLDYYRLYPHIRLDLLITSKEDLQQKLLDRELDVALTYKSPLGEDHIESHLLFRSRLCLVGRIGELKGVGKTVSVQDLTRFPLALPSKGLQARDTLEDVLFAQNVNLDIRLEINSVRTLLDLVGSSPLVTILSEEAIHQVTGFEAVPIDHPDGRMDGCYHYLKGAYHKMAAQKFVELLRENNSFHRIGVQ
ncbi:MAG: substrate-binding domain-containing protein, partial [Bacteroidales bacterium]|nr:substrate-binding domain-containing protein [Bacteroidales bacterium]